MKLMIIFFVTLFSLNSVADCTVSIEIRDTIGPATFDYLEQAIEKVNENKCQSILLKINTPGGNLQSTRKIVELIMSSPFPYLCLIHPSGGHAGSAGAIIMQACHVNGAVEATNIGAASPISGSGEQISDDLRKKLFEDTKSWVEGLAKYHGRSLKFAKDIVTEAKALDAKSAFEQKAIDIVVKDIDEFLEFASKQEVRLKSEEKTLVVVGDLIDFSPGLRHEVLQFFSNPQLVYLIFMGSLGLLYFELTHPGAIVPGVIGAIGLVISLMNFHMLDVSWGGVVLIALGMAFMFAELFVPSFGALGLGGLTSMVVGSLLLFDEKSGFQIPITFLLITTFILFLLMAGLSYLAYQAMRRGEKNRKDEDFTGQEIIIRSFDVSTKTGFGFIHGEIWKVVSDEPLAKDDKAVVVKIKGLTLKVKKIN